MTVIQMTLMDAQLHVKFKTDGIVQFKTHHVIRLAEMG